MKVHSDYLYPWPNAILYLEYFGSQVASQWARNRLNLQPLIILNNFDIRFGLILFGIKVANDYVHQ